MMLEAENIHKSFGSLEVLKGPSLSVEKGQTVSITGASGAGKTTFLQILGTLDRADSGALVIDGTDVMRLSDRSLSAFRAEKIGFVFQSFNLLPEFTALENVMIPSLIVGRSKRQARERAAEMLDKVGLSLRLSHKPSELSGGEMQRVAIARALVNSPAVLFADEPTGNLDSVTGGQIADLFFELSESLGQTIVMVTHSEHLAARCTRCLLMKDGQFVFM